MLGDKQEQSALSGSIALQAGRDVNYHGLSVSEVRELCALFLQNNFPQLRAEAKQAAEQHVRDFAATLEQKLVNNATSIVLDKFREPDVQAAINDAVQASARKGQAASPLILSALIAERVAVNTNDYKDVVLCEAVNVVPKLTAPQIAFLSFHHFVTSVVIKGLHGIAALEPFGQLALLFSTPGFGLSDSQKQHIQYAGACSINHILGGDVYEALRAKPYSYFGHTDAAVFKAAIADQAPAFGTLLDQFSTENLFTVNLTSVGQAIAIANISNYLGKLDYSIWLK